MRVSASFPNLRALDLFVTAVEVGSVAGAARAHMISQPAASAQMRNLERALGFQLLDRTTQGSTPTEHGRIVAGWASRLLDEANVFESAVAAAKSTRASVLRVDASYTIAECFMPEWLTLLRREYPESAVVLGVANSEVVTERLLDLQLCLGFVESAERVDGLCYSQIGCDKLAVVVSIDHPWNDGRAISAEELVAEPLVTRERGSGTRSFFEAALVELGLEPPSPLMELGSAAAVLAATARGDAPAVISEFAARHSCEEGRLVAVEVSDLDLTRPLAAAWPAARPLPELATSLLTLISDGGGVAA